MQSDRATITFCQMFIFILTDLIIPPSNPRVFSINELSGSARSFNFSDMSRSVQFIAVVVAVAHKISTAPKMWRPQWWSPADTDDIIVSPLLPPHIVSILWSQSGILLSPHSVWLCWCCWWGWGRGRGYVRVTILHVVTLYLQLDDMLVSSRSVCIFNMGSCNVGLCKEDILGVTVPPHQGASSLNTGDCTAAQYNITPGY